MAKQTQKTFTDELLLTLTRFFVFVFSSGWYTPLAGLLVSLLLYAWACLLSLSADHKNTVYDIFTTE